MAFFARLHCRKLHLRYLSASAATAGSPSAILNPSDPSAILSAKQKSRSALSLLKSETDPSRIVDICRAAALTPASSLDRNAFLLAVSKLSSSQSFSSIRSLVDELLLAYKDRSPRYLSHAIVLYGKAGMVDDALRAFRSSPSLHSFNALLLACIMSNKHSEVSKFFRKYPTVCGIEPDLETYNTVVKSFAESGSTRSFYSLFDEMLKRKIKPNTTTFCNALEGFYTEQRFEDVKKVLEMMEEHDCTPGLTTYNVRIMGLTKLGMSEQADDLCKELEKKMKPSWVTYSHLILGFAKEGNLEKAKMLYNSMCRNGKVGESWVYFSLINHLCKGGDFEAALVVCNDTMARNWIPCFASMKLLVTGLASKSKVDEAKVLLEKVKERFPKGADMWKEVEEELLK